MDFNGLLDLIARLFVIIGVPAAAIWTWYSKSYAPARLRENETKLKAQLDALEDSREHRQALESEQVRLAALSQSWANEKLFEESHDNNVFLRADVSNGLTEIKTNQRKILMEIQDLKSKFTLLIGILSEVRDDQRRAEKNGTLTDE